jgi:hypothetical protein
MAQEAIEEFIAFWHQFDFSAPPFTHPADKALFEHPAHSKKINLRPPKSPADWVDWTSPDVRPLVQLSLLPMPMCGDLRTADIFICLLNPGLAASDFYAEANHPEYQVRLQNAIAQQRSAVDEYPFFWLDPDLCWTGGAAWWSRKLQSVVAEAARRWGCEFSEAARRISQRIAVLELFPYHSKHFALGSIAGVLPSCQAAVKLAQAIGDDPAKTIIIARKRTLWGVEHDGDRRIVFSAGQERGAHLSADSDGGRAILRRLFPKF